MGKRGKLEIIKDVLTIINKNRQIKITPFRQSNISSARFREYYYELLRKGFIKETNHQGNKLVSINEKGQRFLEKYKTIVSFIDEFEL